MSSRDLPEPPVIHHPPAGLPRIGHGFDLHRLEPSTPQQPRKLVVAGRRLPHDRGVVAHSDGDVVCHALVDALLGALCLGDIGRMFPDDDPAWKEQDSRHFVREALRLVHDHDHVVGNVDVTVILQAPKLVPHLVDMRSNLAELLACPFDRVNLKAKTHEQVDSLGRNESIAAHVVVLLARS